MTYPPVSCMCLTFARPKRLLEEAVYSFLNQDYPGDKELLILNDFQQQTIAFEHPQVTVVNVPARFRTVGEKRNAAAAMCRHDLVALWDDDDICLPHRLSFSISKYDEKKRFFKPSKAFVLNHGVISGPDAEGYHAACMWHRSLFDEVGGYAHMGSGEDKDIEARFEEVIGGGKNYDAIKLCEIYYLYRWSGTQSYHLSGFGRDGSGRSGNDKVMEYALGQLEQGRIQAGEIALVPQWSVDYSQLVREYVAAWPQGAGAGSGGADAGNRAPAETVK
ncbi:MAG: glycosyltransferase family 2 protein [Acidobacteriia bacterium]|nr:glycosyltransferase family 2 protein [Terriglobia bacterium]